MTSDWLCRICILAANAMDAEALALCRVAKGFRLLKIQAVKDVRPPGNVRIPGQPKGWSARTRDHLDYRTKYQEKRIRFSHGNEDHLLAKLSVADIEDGVPRLPTRQAQGRPAVDLAKAAFRS